MSSTWHQAWEEIDSLPPWTFGLRRHPAWRGWKKRCHANGNQKKAGVAILISDKIDFKIKTLPRDKEEHCIMTEGSVLDEDITIVNIYAPNIGATQYIRQMLRAMKGEADSNTVTVGDVNTQLASSAASLPAELLTLLFFPR